MAYRELVARYGDATIAVALAVLYVVELVNYPDAHLRATIPLAVAACLALALRRKAPLLVFLLVTVLNAVASDLAQDFDSNSISFVAVFVFNLYSLGANARRLEAWLGGLAVLATIVAATIQDGDTSPSGYFFFLVLCGLPWGVGVAIRLRSDKDRELRERERLAVLEKAEAIASERARIARELHDTVSHAIAVTVLQSRGGRKMVGRDDEAVRRALASIEQTNTSALADMRRLLGLLRETDESTGRAEPQPSLERLDQLVEEVRSAGLPVDVEVSGEPLPVPPGLDLSAYRIVQEALTNVLKHAGAHARAKVELVYGADCLEVAVTNRGATGTPGTGTGHGLIGIRERVSVAGGTVEAGPAEGGYAVRARLPYLLGSA
jgi:signal transduction histidine kinase